jgi:hypothetical protein
MRFHVTYPLQYLSIHDFICSTGARAVDMIQFSLQVVNLQIQDPAKSYKNDG